MPQRRQFERSEDEPEPDKKYTVLWIPKSGLFYDGGKFFDGHGNEIPWRREITIVPTHGKANTLKEKIMFKYPRARGEVVILGVTLKEID